MNNTLTSIALSTNNSIISNNNDEDENKKKSNSNKKCNCSKFVNNSNCFGNSCGCKKSGSFCSPLCKCKGKCNNSKIGNNDELFFKVFRNVVIRKEIMSIKIKKPIILTAKEKKIAKLIKERDERREELVNALSQKGLKLRSDSSLCHAYIYDGFQDNDRWTLESVVQEMCLMKYLFEYCDLMFS